MPEALGGRKPLSWGFGSERGQNRGASWRDTPSCVLEDGQNPGRGNSGRRREQRKRDDGHLQPGEHAGRAGPSTPRGQF